MSISETQKRLLRRGGTLSSQNKYALERKKRSRWVVKKGTLKSWQWHVLQNVSSFVGLCWKILPGLASIMRLQRYFSSNESFKSQSKVSHKGHQALEVEKI